MRILAKTDVGKVREMNQDYYYIPDENESICVYILADGMGGYTGGEIASTLAVQSVKKYIHNNYENIEHNKENLLNLIKEAIEYANMMVYEKSLEDKDLSEMGTTLDVVLIKNQKAYIGHVGDSKVYRINESNITKITTDHSYVEKLVNDGTITREEAVNHPKKNMLMKAIGSSSFAVPDLIELEINQDDIILMCSDGLTNTISEEEILRTVEKDSDMAVDELIDKANDAGGIDNITVIIIKEII